jgi:hypothetical protein
VNNITFKRLAQALASWSSATLASLANRNNIVLTAGFGAIGALGLPLLIQLSHDRQAGPGQIGQLSQVFQHNGYIGLACFGALAFGYIYWAMQLLAGAAEEDQRPSQRLERWSNLAFAMTLVAAVAALGLWNIGLLVR